MHSEEAVVTMQYPAVTILVHQHREDSSSLFSLVTHGLPDHAPCQQHELMLSSCSPHLDADCDTLQRLAQTIVTTGRPINHESGAVREVDQTPLIGVLAHDPNNAVVVELLPYIETGDNDLMTKANPRWEEFLARVEGPEGCDMALKAFIGFASRIPAPKRRLLMRLTKEILCRMGLKPAERWTRLESQFGL